MHDHPNTACPTPKKVEKEEWKRKETRERRRIESKIKEDTRKKKARNKSPRNRESWKWNEEVGEREEGQEEGIKVVDPAWVEHHTGGSGSTPTVHPC